MLFGMGYNLKRGGDQVTQIMEGNGMEVVPRAPRIQGVRKRPRLSAEDKYQIFQRPARLICRWQRSAEMGHLLFGPGTDKGAGEKRCPGGIINGDGRS